MLCERRLKMELTQEQKILVTLFRQLEMSENLIIATMIAIKEPKQTSYWTI